MAQTTQVPTVQEWLHGPWKSRRMFPHLGQMEHGRYYGLLFHWLGESKTTLSLQERQAATAHARQANAEVRESNLRSRDVRPPVGSGDWMEMKDPWPKEWDSLKLRLYDPQNPSDIRLIDDKRFTSFWWPVWARSRAETEKIANGLQNPWWSRVIPVNRDLHTEVAKSALVIYWSPVALDANDIRKDDVINHLMGIPGHREPFLQAYQAILARMHELWFPVQAVNPKWARWLSSVHELQKRNKERKAIWTCGVPVHYADDLASLFDREEECEVWKNPNFPWAKAMVETMEMKHHALSPTSSTQSPKAKLNRQLLEEPWRLLVVLRANLHQGCLSDAWSSANTVVVWGRLKKPTLDHGLLLANVQTPDLGNVLHNRPPKGMLIYMAAWSAAFEKILTRQASGGHCDSALEVLQSMKRCTINRIAADQTHMQLNVGTSFTYDKKDPYAVLKPHAQRLHNMVSSTDPPHDPDAEQQYELVAFPEGADVLLFFTPSVHPWSYAFDAVSRGMIKWNESSETYTYQCSNPLRRMFGDRSCRVSVWDTIRDNILPLAVQTQEIEAADEPMLQKLMTDAVFLQFTSHAGSGKSYFVARLSRLWEMYWEHQKSQLGEPFSGLQIVCTAFNSHRWPLIQKLRVAGCKRVFVHEAGVDGEDVLEHSSNYFMTKSVTDLLESINSRNRKHVQELDVEASRRIWPEPWFSEVHADRVRDLRRMLAQAIGERTKFWVTSVLWPEQALHAEVLQDNVATIVCSHDYALKLFASPPRWIKHRVVMTVCCDEGQTIKGHCFPALAASTDSLLICHSPWQKVESVAYRVLDGPMKRDPEEEKCGEAQMPPLPMSNSSEMLAHAHEVFKEGSLRFGPEIPKLWHDVLSEGSSEADSASSKAKLRSWYRDWTSNADHQTKVRILSFARTWPGGILMGHCDKEAWNGWYDIQRDGGPEALHHPMIFLNMMILGILLNISCVLGASRAAPGAPKRASGVSIMVHYRRQVRFIKDTCRVIAQSLFSNSWLALHEIDLDALLPDVETTDSNLGAEAEFVISMLLSPKHSGTDQLADMCKKPNRRYVATTRATKALVIFSQDLPTVGWDEKNNRELLETQCWQRYCQKEGFRVGPFESENPCNDWFSDMALKLRDTAVFMCPQLETDARVVGILTRITHPTELWRFAQEVYWRRCDVDYRDHVVVTGGAKNSGLLDLLAHRHTLHKVVRGLNRGASCRRPNVETVRDMNTIVQCVESGVWQTSAALENCVMVPTVSALLQGGQRAFLCIRFFHRELVSHYNQDEVSHLIGHASFQALRSARLENPGGLHNYDGPECQQSAFMHKLSMERVRCDLIFNKACATNRHSICLGNPETPRKQLLKTYEGMGQPGDHPQVTGHLFISYDHWLCGRVLRQLVDVCGGLMPVVLIKCDIPENTRTPAEETANEFTSQLKDGYGASVDSTGVWKPLECLLWHDQEQPVKDLRHDLRKRL